MCCFPGRKASFVLQVCLLSLPGTATSQCRGMRQQCSPPPPPPPPLAAGCKIKVSPKWRVGVQILWTISASPGSQGFTHADNLHPEAPPGRLRLPDSGVMHGPHRAEAEIGSAPQQQRDAGRALKEEKVVGTVPRPSHKLQK